MRIKCTDYSTGHGDLEIVFTIPYHHLKPRSLKCYNLRTAICALDIGLYNACFNGIEHCVCNTVFSKARILIDTYLFGFLCVATSSFLLRPLNLFFVRLHL